MEGIGGDFKSPDHGLHHIPRLHPWISGESRHRYRHPRCQNDSADSGLDVGCPVPYLHVPAQGVLRLGQVQVHGYLGGVGRGPLSQVDPTEILEEAHNGGKYGWLLRDGVPVSARGDTGRSALPHHI